MVLLILALLAQTPSTPSKIQIIRGKPLKRGAPVATEITVGAAQQPSALEQQNKQRAAELDAKEKALSEKEKALKEKEDAAEEEKQKQAKVNAARQQAVQKQHQQNEAMMQDINGALGGE